MYLTLKPSLLFHITFLTLPLHYCLEKFFLLGKVEKLIVGMNLNEKTVYIFQNILYAACKITTPLTLGSAFLITLLNHMDNCVSYDTFQRYLTTICEKMLEAEREEGIFVPPAVKGCKFIHFAVDNADWHEKTPDGSTFHAMTEKDSTDDRSDVVLNDPGDSEVTNALTNHAAEAKCQQSQPVYSNNNPQSFDQKCNTDTFDGSICLKSKQPRTGHFGDISMFATTKATKRSLKKSTSSTIEPHFISLPERRKAR
jgi:hypothetical protein